ncbi:MAG TPA: hypothetical protein DDX39_10000 [Bacteroidales bacterium]|nr:MAG: hypothetical protein A2W98_01375 [Bacteroidetes bacterium GWF2_33_38]OFY72439.1 MAG: hypothetical protein A2265_03315 [Bacteroidetes bacterium RIFOXYA12_FULL_33_9]HBF88962.1 hypothetical protein [Bacteroidales bacterium]
MWKFPWKLSESLFFGFGLLLTGFLIEIVSRVEISAPAWPLNLIVILVFAFIIILCGIFLKNNPFIKWLSGINAAISAIVFFTGLTVLMGLIPQLPTDNKFISHLGLNRITSSFPYAILLIYFLTSLGFVTIKRLKPFNKKNLGFFFNHFGLWLVIISANLGTGDLQKLNMTVNENQTEWRAVDEYNQVIELPIAIELKDFDIEEFNPKLLIFNNQTSEIESKPYLIDTINNIFHLNDYEIAIEKFYKYSSWYNDSFHKMLEIGNPSSVFVKIKLAGNIITEGWISSETFIQRQRNLQIDSLYTIVMVAPEPKRYFSEITVYSDNDETIKTTLEVNKPLRINGWTLYQVSYDETKGKWSNYSIIQFVRDPWLPVVYIGIGFLIIGVFFIIIRGEKLKH